MRLRQPTRAVPFAVTVAREHDGHAGGGREPASPEQRPHERDRPDARRRRHVPGREPGGRRRRNRAGQHDPADHPAGYSYQPTILQITGTTAPTQSLLILAPATKAVYDQWTGEKDNPGEGGATVFPSPPAQPWVALKPGSDQRQLEVTLAHEMLHALTLTFASKRDQPTWLTEGFAQLVSADVTQIVELAATPPAAASLPTDAQFTAQPGRSYVLAFLFATFLQQKRRDAVAAFYTPAVHGQPGDLDRLAHNVFGAVIPELTGQWQAQYAAQVKTLRG